MLLTTKPNTQKVLKVGILLGSLFFMSVPQYFGDPNLGKYPNRAKNAV